jgi:hypothetical protein
MHSPELVSLANAAMTLRVTADSLRRRLQAGTIAGELIADRYYVRREDLDRITAERDSTLVESGDTAGRSALVVLAGRKISRTARDDR